MKLGSINEWMIFPYFFRSVCKVSQPCGESEFEDERRRVPSSSLAETSRPSPASPHGFGASESSQDRGGDGWFYLTFSAKEERDRRSVSQISAFFYI